MHEFVRHRDITLTDLFCNKNPYLFRAVGLESAPELVLRVLDAFQSASDETIFGDCFFEPLAKVVSRGKVGEARGIDFAIETQDTYSAYAMKSGPKIFNASQGIQQDTEFTELLQRLKKIRKQFDPVLAHGYGRKNVGITKKRRYRIASGQRFWEEITGDSDFYLKIMRVMNDYPRIHNAQYGPVWAATKARIAFQPPTVKLVEAFLYNALQRFWSDFQMYPLKGRHPARPVSASLIAASATAK